MFSQAVTDTEMSPVIRVNVSSEVRCGPAHSSVSPVNFVISQSRPPEDSMYYFTLYWSETQQNKSKEKYFLKVGLNSQACYEELFIST